MGRRVDPGASLHAAGSHIVQALRWLAEAADALDAERCRDLLYLAEFGARDARAGYYAGPPRVLALWVPGVVPRYRIFRSPEAPTQYRRLRASAEAALRGALEQGWQSGTVPRGIAPFASGSVLWVDYGFSPEGGPLDVDNVWVKVISDSLQSIGIVEDDRFLVLAVTHRTVSPAEAYTAAALLDFRELEDPFASFRRLRDLALSSHSSTHSSSH